MTAVGTAISGVQILVDGTAVGTATYGIPRPDVCAAYPGRVGCPNVGFTYQLNTLSLSSGIHTIAAAATDTDSPPNTASYSMTVTVVGPPPPSVYIDSPASGTALLGAVTVSGWAIDNMTAVGTAISSVQIKLDGALVGTATYGIARPDVCAAYPGRVGCPNVGFTYQLNAASLSSGAHTLTAVATDSDPNPDTGSFSLNVRVGTLASSTTLASSLNPSTYFQNVTLTATVAPSSANGAVTFENNGAILGTKALVNGQASLTTGQLGTGTRSLRAYYTGDGTNGASQSAVLSQTVNAPSASSFQSALNYSISNPQFVTTGDFNGDGKTDLVVAESDTVGLLIGHGDGSLTRRPSTSFAAGGQRDICCRGRLQRRRRVRPGSE